MGSYLEDFYFFLTILFLYLPCVALGNFFFFNFLSPIVFSFLDFSIGLFFIFFGFIFFKNSPQLYLLVNSLIRIFFLSIISSSYLSNKLNNISYKGEFTWGELFGAKGLSLKNFVFASYRIRLYALKISQLVIIFA